MCESFEDDSDGSEDLGGTELDRRVLLSCWTFRPALRRSTEEVREAISSAYETKPGDPRFCVRRFEVVEHAANPWDRGAEQCHLADVEAAASALGFQAVKNGNRSLFRCAKRRDHDDEPRWPCR